jgi:hypothetical protein
MTSESRMTRERYAQWMKVWRWFQTQPRTHGLENLYEMLNELWQQDRQSSTPDQFANYLQAPGIEDDPKFREFLQKLDQAFVRDPPAELP